MSTLTNLTKLGINPQEIRNGEVIELDTLTLKDAKKEGWTEVTNANDSSDVILAYAKDLANILEENELLENDKDELEQQLNHLSQENGQLTEALNTERAVDQRIDEFTALMDDMESQLNVLTQHKNKGEQELQQLRDEIERLTQERDVLRDDVSRLQADRDELEHERDDLEAQIQNLEEKFNIQDDQIIQYDQAWSDLERDVNQVMSNLYEKAREAGVKFEE